MGKKPRKQKGKGATNIEKTSDYCSNLTLSEGGREGRLKGYFLNCHVF
jgi:hypothetical protein